MRFLEAALRQVFSAVRVSGYLAGMARREVKPADEIPPGFVLYVPKAAAHLRLVDSPADGLDANVHGDAA